MTSKNAQQKMEVYGWAKERVAEIERSLSQATPEFKVRVRKALAAHLRAHDTEATFISNLAKIVQESLPFDTTSEQRAEHIRILAKVL